MRRLQRVIAHLAIVAVAATPYVHAQVELDPEPLQLDAPAVDAVPQDLATPPAIEAPAIEDPALEAPAVEVPPPAQDPVAPFLDPFLVDPEVAAPPAAEPSSDSVSVIMGQEETKRRAYRAHLRETLASAQAAMQASRFDAAIEFYDEAYTLVLGIGNRPEDRAERDAALVGLAEAEYRHAMFMRRQGDLAKALDLARQSAGRGHPEAPKLAGELVAEIEKPKPVKVERTVPRWQEKAFKGDVKELDGLIRRGRERFATGEYAEARTLFEAVLSRDPENTEAIRMLEKIGQSRYDSASIEFAATKADMIARIRDTWNPRDYQFSAAETVINKPPEPRPSDSVSLKIKKKMEGIKIPQIEFRQANIHDVIKFLTDASDEFDETTSKDEERGVNIVLNLHAGLSGATARPAAAADPFALAATGAPATDAADTDITPITFSATYVSLYEALNIVTEMTGLKYRISGTVVMVVRKDAPDGEILNRMYDVLPSVGVKIDDVRPAVRAGGGGDSDFRAMGGAGIGETRGDWKDFFAEMGVGWPQGSSIKYIPTIGKIIVANTAENLTVFESVLGVLNVVPFQIEIEARFVEVGQHDLDSLGFEWNLTDDWEIATKKDTSGNSVGAQQRISMAATSFTGGMRYSDTEGAIGETTVNDSLVTVASVLTNPELQFVLHALQQRGSTDLLSAPKVTTQSGLEATLKVVTEYIYPTSFEIVQQQSQGNSAIVQNSIPVAEPSNFETREVGVILSVLPEVSTEGQMINLTMSPEVVSDPEWFNYGTTYTDTEGNEQQIYMPQPFFHNRSIQTSISVYNGATVVMGGLIAEKRTTVEDQIPFLGDIPLIGRLFRSSVEDSQKRNLLIFVTARLVDPAGRPVRRSETQLPGIGTEEVAVAPGA